MYNCYINIKGGENYEKIFGMLENSGILVVAMVFVIIALLAGIFYFCACTGNYDGADLGVGAVLCALLSIFAAFGAGFIGCKKVLNK